MAILLGKRLGPYEILSSIGAGGMGEVYRARDTRLDRTVAVKVLPTHLADRSDLRERFEREARTIASLNHPHICTLFDIGQQDGIDYLVMEYLEGETLAQRLLKGPLPLQQVLQYAIEISDALGKAHRKGVTHRDLKPGNIMLTKSGTKLLDFGLAKLKQEVAPPNMQLSQLPTANDPLTAQGMIVGTLQYMAPEQLEGKDVDARTDIFAFGAVVYEMATGKRAFEGKTQASVVGAILKDDPPPISSLQPMTPPALDRVVKKCLAKEPEKRWQATSDVCDELKWISESGSQAGKTATPGAPVQKNLRKALVWAAVGPAACALVGLAAWNLKPTPPKPVTRTVITLPADQRLAMGENPEVTISPDGRLLAYAALQGGVQQLYLRAMDSLVARALPGTDGAVNPFFSPDSQSLGFFAGGKLKKVSVNGGGATTLGDAAIPRGASWGSQGAIAFTPSFGGPVQQMPETGGAVKPLTQMAKGDTSHRWPEALPDGQAVLFATGLTTSSMQVAVYVTGTGKQRILVPVPGSTQPRYAASGHLLYVQGSTLMAAPFDARRQVLTGEAVPVVENVQGNRFGAAQYSISTTGSLVYVSGGSQSDQNRLVWVSRDGKEQPLAAPPRAYDRPQISPDGRKVTVEQDGQIWVYELARDTMTRFTFEGSNNFAPVWTPDGSRIAFQSNNDGPTSVFWQKADGSGGMEKLTGSEYTRFPKSWSADGQLLSFGEINPTTGYDIWVLDMKDRKAVPFLRTPFYEVGVFSPDGRWMAYTSNESGRDEVYVQPYPGPGGKWQISTDGGMDVRWTANGRELTYRNGDKMMAADIATQPAFSAGKPRMLFEGPYVPPSPLASFYDVSADGQRFLMLKPSESAEAPSTQINVVLNWFEELKQKVPTGKK